MPLTVFTSDRFADHLTPPGHPERVERFDVMLAVARKPTAASSPSPDPLS